MERYSSKHTATNGYIPYCLAKEIKEMNEWTDGRLLSVTVILYLTWFNREEAEKKVEEHQRRFLATLIAEQR